eukprot:Lankesteria_metandrocarpae@DN2690_c0_g1_i1.p1
MAFIKTANVPAVLPPYERMSAPNQCGSNSSNCIALKHMFVDELQIDLEQGSADGPHAETKNGTAQTFSSIQSGIIHDNTLQIALLLRIPGALHSPVGTYLALTELGLLYPYLSAAKIASPAASRASLTALADVSHFLAAGEVYVSGCSNAHGTAPVLFLGTSKGHIVCVAISNSSASQDKEQPNKIRIKTLWKKKFTNTNSSVVHLHASTLPSAACAPMSSVPTRGSNSRRGSLVVPAKTIGAVLVLTVVETSGAVLRLHFYDELLPLSDSENTDDSGAATDCTGSNALSCLYAGAPVATYKVVCADVLGEVIRFDSSASQQPPICSVLGTPPTATPVIAKKWRHVGAAETFVEYISVCCDSFAALFKSTAFGIFQLSSFPLLSHSYRNTAQSAGASINSAIELSLLDARLVMRTSEYNQRYASKSSYQISIILLWETVATTDDSVGHITGVRNTTGTDNSCIYVEEMMLDGGGGGAFVATGKMKALSQNMAAGGRSISAGRIVPLSTPSVSQTTAAANNSTAALPPPTAGVSSSGRSYTVGILLLSSVSNTVALIDYPSTTTSLSRQLVTSKQQLEKSTTTDTTICSSSSSGWMAGGAMQLCNYASLLYDNCDNNYYCSATAAEAYSNLNDSNAEVNNTTANNSSTTTANLQLLSAAKVTVDDDFFMFTDSESVDAASFVATGEWSGVAGVAVTSEQRQRSCVPCAMLAISVGGGKHLVFRLWHMVVYRAAEAAAAVTAQSKSPSRDIRDEVHSPATTLRNFSLLRAYHYHYCYYYYYYYYEYSYQYYYCTTTVLLLYHMHFLQLRNWLRPEIC